MTNAVAMTIAALLQGVLSASVNEAWSLPSQPSVVAALVYLLTLKSVGLFILVLLVVRTWTSSAGSYMFVLFPVVALGLAAWLTNEPVTLSAVLGAALVMVGALSGPAPPAQVSPDEARRE